MFCRHLDIQVRTDPDFAMLQSGQGAVRVQSGCSEAWGLELSTSSCRNLVLFYFYMSQVIAIAVELGRKSCISEVRAFQPSLVELASCCRQVFTL